MMRRAPHCSITKFTALCLATLATGCGQSLFRNNFDTSAIEDVVRDDSKLISKYTHPYGLNYIQVSKVGLVTGLDGTGGDPAPTPQRAALLEEMKRHNVPEPSTMLASPATSIVIVRGFLRPGMRKGDRFDVEVSTPPRSETTSLRNGWLLPARLTEHAVLGDRVRSGHKLADAEGDVLVDPSASGDENLETRGRILGGGVAVKDRPMGLIISHENKSVRLSKEIAGAINARFYAHDKGKKAGVATPKTDEFVEIILHPRYQENITRYVKVIRNIPVRESATEQQVRINRLGAQLLDPVTSATAAIRLEALGDEQSVEALKKGAANDDPEVRFYAAEALAYLDETAAVAPLAEAARDEPAFRVNALAALSAMDDVVAYDALRSLLEVRSAETRYGSFRALWSMNELDPLVRGEQLGEQFSYHRLAVESPPMIHVTRSYRPEIVLFGMDHQLQLPLLLNAGKRILVNGLTGDQVTVSRFEADQPTQKRVVSTSVDAVVRAIVELGGTYPDVVQALQQAKQDGALLSSLRVDALPESGREYERGSDAPLDPEDAGAAPYKVATPLPDLFSRQK